MPEIGSLFVKLGLDTQEFNKNLGLIRSSVQRVGASLARFSAAASVPLVAVGKRAFETAVRFDKLERGLTAITGSAAATAQQMNRLRAVAQLPGLSLEEAIEGSINLQAVGFSATLAERSLKAVGNALVTVGKGKEDLAGVNLALTQIISKGKVSAEEINQIAERLPQVRTAMQDAFGTASSQAIQKLGISAEQFVEGLVTQLEKLPSAAGGIANDLENASQSVDDAFRAIGQAIIPVVSDILQTVVPAIVRVTEIFKSLSPEVKRSAVIFGAVVVALGPVALAFSALLTPMGATVAIIGAVAAGAFLIIRNWEKIGSFFATLWDGIATIFRTSLESLLIRLKLFFLQFLDILTGSYARIAGVIARLAEAAGFDAIGQRLRNIQQGFSNLISDEAIQENQNRLDALASQWQGAFSSIVGTVGDAGRGIVDSITGTISQAQGVVESFTAGVTTAGTFSSSGSAMGSVQETRRRAVEGLQPIKLPVATQPIEIELPDTSNATRSIRGLQTELEQLKREAIEASGEFQFSLATVSAFGEGIAEAFGEAIGELFNFKDGFNSLQDTLANFGRAFTRILQQVIRQLAAAVAKALILRAIFAAFGLTPPGGGGSGGFLRFAAQLFGGGRQFGGPVSPGRAFLVGEAGPELFVPRQAGSIIPNSAGISAIPLKATSVDIGGDTLRLIIQSAEQTSNRRRGF